MVAKLKCPDRGDIGWLSLDPQSGREQAGRRPVVCLTPSAYNRKSGLAIICPITCKTKGYPFEVAISAQKGVEGVVLADQMRSLDWNARAFEKIGKCTESQLSAILSRAAALLTI